MINTAQTTKPIHKIKVPDSDPPFLMRVVITLLLMTLVFGISIAISLYGKEVNTPPPANFNECSVAKGSIIQESYPPVCISKKGQRFIKPLTDSETKLPEPSGTNGNGMFCGGIAGVACPEGSSCKLDGGYPDSGGKCIKN
jgi:hypothetical protein